MIISTAPGRCGIVGNPTDMYGGSVLSCSTVERAYCTITESPTLILSADEFTQKILTNEDLNLKGDRLDIPKAILLYFSLTPENFKVKLSFKSDVPECAGLAGSTAIVVAVLGAVLKYINIEMNHYLIAETARKIEFGIMGITCGYQDQYMASFGGFNYMDFRYKEWLAQDESEPLATIEPLQRLVTDIPIIVAHTGIKRNSGVVHRSIRDRWLGDEIQVVEGYLRIAELARLGKRAVLQEDWQMLGRLMDENHEIQRLLGGSGPENDYLIEVARKSGALGAKLAGAGKGGTIVALTLKPDDTANALQKAGAKRILRPRPTPGLTVEAEREQLYTSTQVGSS